MQSSIEKFELGRCKGFPGGASGKNLPANARDIRDTGSILGQEAPLEKEMATHSSILAWKVPWTKKTGGLQSLGCKESDMTRHKHTH